MRFSCERAVLQSAVSAALRTVSQKSSIAVLEGILLKAEGDGISLTGYDLATGIVAKAGASVQENGSIVLSARLFSDIVRRLEDDFVTVECDEKLVCRITCARSEFDLMGMFAEEFPELPSVAHEQGVSLPQSALKRLISKTLFCVADGGSRPVHTGALFDAEGRGLNVVALDGFRLAVASFEFEQELSEKLHFVVPGGALREVERLCSEDGEVMLTIGNRHVMFTIGDTTLVSRLLEGEFINYRTAIPSDPALRVNLKTKALQGAVERVSIMISERLKSPVRMRFSQDNVILSSVTAVGRATDEIPCSDGNTLEIGFNNRYFLDAVKAIETESLIMEMTNGVSPCVLRPDGENGDCTYMVLPVRLKANGQ